MLLFLKNDVERAFAHPVLSFLKPRAGKISSMRRARLMQSPCHLT
jgi:hypothetical protein